MTAETSPLIRVEDLVDSLANVCVCDLRWDLTNSDKGRASHESGHIPGAVFVDLDRDLAAPPAIHGRHPLPDVAEFASVLGNLGIAPDTHVVVYDDNGGRIAARLWWMLRSIGHDHVRLLDGGYRAWVAAGEEVEVGVVTRAPAVYPVPDGFSGVITHDRLDTRIVIDAREGERYRGETEPVDPKAGHIPGAINIPTSANLADDGRLRSPSELAELYSGLGSGTVVSCGSGVTACHAALAMVVAGKDMPDVYVGSFSEWSRLDRQVAIGPLP